MVHLVQLGVGLNLELRLSWRCYEVLYCVKSTKSQNINKKMLFDNYDVIVSHILMRSSLKFQMVSFDIHIKVIGCLCRGDHPFELFDQILNHGRSRGRSTV